MKTGMGQLSVYIWSKWLKFTSSKCLQPYRDVLGVPPLGVLDQSVGRCLPTGSNTNRHFCSHFNESLHESGPSVWFTSCGASVRIYQLPAGLVIRNLFLRMPVWPDNRPVVNSAEDSFSSAVCESSGRVSMKAALQKRHKPLWYALG